MAITPFICQSMFAQTGSATLVLSLPSAPTPGNTLYILGSGFASTFTVPSGFTQVVNNSQTYNASFLYSKVATSADVSNRSYTISGMSDIHMFALLEVSGQPTVTASYGASSGANPLTTGSLAGASSSNTMRLLLYEWDQRGPTPTSLPGGYYQLSDGTFSDSTYSYHASVIYQIPAETSGVQSLPMSGSCNYPVWMDLCFTSSGPLLVQTDQKICQNATAETVTLPNNVKAGNLLLLICFGPDANYTQPSGFSPPISGSGGGSAVSYSYKIATSSDGNGFVVVTHGDVYNFQIMEIAGGTAPASVAKGACTVSGQTITTGPTVNSTDASSLIVLLVGWRERDLQPTRPLPFYDADYGHDYFISSHWAPRYACNAYVTPSVWGGQSQSVSLSGVPSSCAYIALQITSKSGRANRASVVWMF